MLGSAADAGDVVQEAWLRWAAIDDAARAEVRDPRAYLRARCAGCGRRVTEPDDQVRVVED
jgi:hypothetical protein